MADFGQQRQERGRLFAPVAGDRTETRSGRNQSDRRRLAGRQSHQRCHHFRRYGRRCRFHRRRHGSGGARPTRRRRQNHRPAVHYQESLFETRDGAADDAQTSH